MTPVSTFSGKCVALFGLGGSGLSTARALIAGGARVVAWDDGEAGRAKAQAAGVEVADLAEADWTQFDALVLSPGVPLTHPTPHWTVERAKAAGVEIIGDIELFCREREKLAAGSPFIAITGTNGKSTTTALIAHILKEAGRDVQLGGNIGTPILDLEPPSEERIHVIECSSFQIDLAPSLAPMIGVLINLTPDHIDRHGTMEHYAAVKERLVAKAEIALIGVDDDWCHAIGQRLTAAASEGQHVMPVSAERVLDWGYYVEGDAHPVERRRPRHAGGGAAWRSDRRARPAGRAQCAKRRLRLRRDLALRPRGRRNRSRPSDLPRPAASDGRSRARRRGRAGQ